MQSSKFLRGSIFSLILLSLLLFLGCEENPLVLSLGPELLVVTTYLDYGTEATEQTFMITNDGDGTLEWSILTNDDWIMVTPNDGSTTTETDVILVTVDRSGLSTGSYEGEIVISPSSGTAKSISITMVVSQQPELSVSVVELDFGSSFDDLPFTVSNSGIGTLEWSITSTQEWISFSPESGSTTTGSNNVMVTVDRSELEEGSYEGVIEINPNYGVAKSISIMMVVTAEPELSISETELDFGSLSSELSFQVSNSGQGTLEWTISSSHNWLICSPIEGTTTENSDMIPVNVDRRGLSNGTYNGEIEVTPNVGEAKSISVQMIVLPPVLSISREELDFGSNETGMSFTINNTGGGILSWEITEDQGWLSVSPSSGETSVESDQVTVTVNRTGLSAGEYTSQISLSTNGGDRNITVVMSQGALVWEYLFSSNADLDSKWDCVDDDGDLWGVVDFQNRGTVAWCNGRGEHPDGTYDSFMSSTMRLKSDEAMDIRSYSDVVIRFWMYYETELDEDFVYLTVLGNDDSWYFVDATKWSGTNGNWRQYEVHISDWGDVTPESFLRFGFEFTSDWATQLAGAYIDYIEVWGIE